MTAQASRRDYSLTGPEGDRAVARGLAAAQWYRSDIPRGAMKALMQRADQPAIRDTAIWLGCMVLFGGLGVWTWGSWWCLPSFAAYGVLYGSASDSRWHECGHGSAFQTPWMNRAVYQIACFMIMRNPVTWRASHTRHHADTIIVGRDPEIAVMRPARLIRILGNFFGLIDVPQAMRLMLLNARGRLDPEEGLYIPEALHSRVHRVARIWCAIYAATAGAALATQSILPFMLIGLPRLYGAWHMVLTGILQHAGLAEDVLDHRLNSRTVYLNPLSRFIYWNMNYHVEHHMFPMVPCHALPKLHALLRDDLPAPTPGLWAGYREVFQALRIQRRNPAWFIKRPLPPTAKPYRPEFHGDIEPVLGGATTRAA